MTRPRMEFRCWGEGEKKKNKWKKMSKKLKRNNKSRWTHLGLVSPAKGLGSLILGTIQGILCIYDSPAA